MLTKKNALIIGIVLMILSMIGSYQMGSPKTYLELAGRILALLIMGFGPYVYVRYKNKNKS